ncbi:MAG: hypothetical protein D6675_07425 [Gemmatimonadetes bacterium]|nr:MAG: hypothetical protein D6675_07425 [Gemmatimonadota bacterium]
MAKGEKIGVLAIQDYRFISTLLNIINTSPKARECNIVAEWVKLSELRAGFGQPYRVILDWASHKMPFYRTALKQTLLHRTYVINNPYWLEMIENRFLGYALAKRWNMPVPRAVFLPQQQPNGEFQPQDFRNLKYPLDWKAITEWVGFPARLRPVHRNSALTDQYVSSVDELLHAYHQTGSEPVMLEAWLDYDQYVRSYTIGKNWVINIKYLPHQHQYVPDHQHLSDKLGLEIETTSLTISQLLGYDINMIEYGLKAGQLYIVDMLNPIPDIQPEIITPFYFSELVERIALMCVDYVFKPPHNHQLPNWVKHLFL